MLDRWLIAIGLCVTAIGITGLLFSLMFMEPPTTSVSGATQAGDGTAIKTQGVVQSTRTANNRTTITIMAPASIDVTTESAITLAKDDCVIVSGKRATFAGKAQISASKIVRCTQ